MPEFASKLDGIPVVNTTAARAGMFPSPSVNQRVHNLETDSIDRWTGSAWESLPLTISTTGNMTVASLTANGITTGDVTVTDRLLVANGTAAAPGVAFEGDTNTGMYREAADAISLSVGGVGRIQASTTDVTLIAATIIISGNLSMTGDQMFLSLGETSQEVTFGANDSGGTGFRALVVPNA